MNDDTRRWEALASAANPLDNEVTDDPSVIVECAEALRDVSVEVRRLRAELAATQARCDAAEREVATARAEERAACARIARDESESERETRDWLRSQGMPGGEAHARMETAALIERRIIARGGDHG